MLCLLCAVRELSEPDDCLVCTTAPTVSTSGILPCSRLCFKNSSPSLELLDTVRPREDTWYKQDQGDGKTCTHTLNCWIIKELYGFLWQTFLGLLLVKLKVRKKNAYPQTYFVCKENILWHLGMLLVKYFYHYLTFYNNFHMTYLIVEACTFGAEMITRQTPPKGKIFCLLKLGMNYFQNLTTSYNLFGHDYVQM